MRNIILIFLTLTIMGCATAQKPALDKSGEPKPLKEKEVLFISDQRTIPLNFDGKAFTAWLDSTLVHLEADLPADSIPRNVWISMVLNKDGKHQITAKTNPSITGYKPTLDMNAVPVPKYKDFKLLFVFNRNQPREGKIPQDFLEKLEDMNKRNFFLMNLEEQNIAYKKWCDEVAMPLFVDGMQDVIEKVPALKTYMDFVESAPDTLTTEQLTEREKLFWMADAEFSTDRPLLQYYRVLLHIQHGEYDKASSVYLTFLNYAAFATPLSLIIQDAMDYYAIMSRQLKSDIDPITNQLEEGYADGAQEKLEAVLANYPKSPNLNYYMLMLQYPEYYREGREEEFAELFREKIYKQCDVLYMDSYPAISAKDIYLMTKIRLNLFPKPDQFASELDYYYLSGQMMSLLDAHGYAAVMYRRGMERSADEEVKNKFYLLYIYSLSKLGVEEMNYESTAFAIPESLVQEAIDLFNEEVVSEMQSEVDSLQTKYENLTHFHKGLALFQAGALQEAKKELTLCIEESPYLVDPFIIRGKINTRLDQYPAAENDFSRAIELGSDKIELLYWRSTSYAMQGKLAEAIEDIDAYIERNPNNRYVLYLRGIYYQEAGEYEKSIEDLSWLINHDTDYPEAWLQRGVSYFRNGEYGFALKDFNEYIALDPENPYAFSQRAAVKMLVDQKESALADIERAIELDADEGFYLKLKGDLYFSLDQYDNAINAYQESLRLLDRAQSAVYDMLAHCYYFKKNYRKAVDTINKAIELEPEEPRFYKFKASYLSELEKYDEALAAIDKAIELDQGNGDLLSSRAGILVDAGKYEEATETYRRAIELQPDFMGALLSYSELLIIMGDYAEAEKQAKLAPERTDQDQELVVALFLEMISRRLRDLPYDSDKVDKYLYDGLKLNWWSFELMKEWLETAKTPEDDRQFIRQYIERMETYRDF